jgi:hypothetical protein
MMEWLTIVGPVVTAICALLGTYFSNKKQTALMEYRLKKLEEKVGLHNGLESRVVTLETRMHDLHPV